MDRQIFSLFQVHLEGLRKNKLEFMIQGNQQTSTVDMWPYYEFEDFIRLLNKRNEEEKKAKEKSEKDQKTPNLSNYSNMMKTPNFKVPNFNIPK